VFFRLNPIDRLIVNYAKMKKGSKNVACCIFRNIFLYFIPKNSSRGLKNSILEPFSNLKIMDTKTILKCFIILK
jgi:hypothetical protein